MVGGPAADTPVLFFLFSPEGILEKMLQEMVKVLNDDCGSVYTERVLRRGTNVFMILFSCCCLWTFSGTSVE